MYRAGHAGAAGRARAHRGEPPAASARSSSRRRFVAALGALEGGDQLQRVPAASRRTTAAAQYLKYRLFVAGREFPGSLRDEPRFYAGLLDVFRQVAPLVRFLNEPLLNG